MKRRLAVAFAILVLIVAGSFTWTSRARTFELAKAPATVPAGAFRFAVLHTNDLHSHLSGSGPDAAFRPEIDPLSPVRGHTARLLTAIKGERERRTARDEPVLLVDAGDFFGGTLFDALGPSAGPEFPELEFFATAGYDAITLGNHEYDAGEDGLERMIHKKRVPLVTTNLEGASADWPGVRSLVKVLRSGDRELRVLILGIQGPDAAKNSMGMRRRHSFVGLNENLRADFPALTALLQREIDAHLADTDVRVLIAHSGEPEDARLAAGLRHLELFIAGHTHQLYRHARRVGSTLLVQAGSHGAYLGNLDLAWTGERLEILNPERPYTEIDGRIEADRDWAAHVDELETKIDPMIAGFGFKSRDVVVTLKEDRLRGRTFGDPYGIHAVTLIKNSLDKKLEKPLDLYITSLGLIRDDLRTDGRGPTPQLFSDVFRVFGVGFDEKLRPGSPVTDFYARKDDFLRLVNFLEFYRHFSGNFTPIFSEDFSYRPRWGIPLYSQVADAKFRGRDFADWPELLHIGTSLYVAAFFPKLKRLSAGFVDPSPRDANGKPLEGFTAVSDVNEATLFAEGLRNER